MRIAVFSDVHGNSLALDAVLADVRTRDVDAIWIVGDVADMGADPVGVVERLRQLDHLVVVRGNADRAIWDIHLRDELASVRSQDDDGAVLTLMFLAEGAWTQGILLQAGHLDWIKAFPLDRRETLPDGTRVLLVHARPGNDDGEGFLPDQTDDEIRALLGQAEADLVFVGHTHTALDRTVDGVRVINTGSVSNPPREDKRPTWLLLDADEAGHRVETFVVDYDIDRYLHSLIELAHPARARIWEYFGRELAID